VVVVAVVVVVLVVVVSNFVLIGNILVWKAVKGVLLIGAFVGVFSNGVIFVDFVLGLSFLV